MAKQTFLPFTNIVDNMQTLNVLAKQSHGRIIWSHTPVKWENNEKITFLLCLLYVIEVPMQSIAMTELFK